MSDKILKNLFFLNYIIFILTINLSCSDYSLLLSRIKIQAEGDNTNATEDTNEVDYPFTKYKSTASLECGYEAYGSYKFVEDTSVKIDSTKITITNTYRDESFQVSVDGDIPFKKCTRIC